MEKAKNLGIWMDHASAHIMEYTADPIESTTIESKSTHQVRESSMNERGERHMHIKEQHQQASFYKKLGETILNYDEVILFGPTDAKVELFNVLNADNRFAKVKIDVQQADKMTEHQEQAYVRDYFSRK